MLLPILTKLKFDQDLSNFLQAFVILLHVFADKKFFKMFILLGKRSVQLLMLMLNFQLLDNVTPLRPLLLS